MNKITLGLLLFVGSLHAQLQVDNLTQNPAQLVQNVLIGQGVTPTNIKYNGSLINANVVSDQVAHFTTNFNPTNLGVNEGLLMATGNAKVALGPNNQGGAQMATTSTVQGDPDLALLSGKTIFKVCIIEFDFVATGLELNFDYVFASEEYPEWVNTLYNDTFGFFLSGPGISGPYANNAKNIALIPSTTTPISVDNVNAGMNSTYFVNNGTGSTPGVNSSIQYDGFTTLLRATSALQCGQTYHIKLAIAQASDSNLDSAVFLKNFRIKPMELLDTELNSDNTSVCYGKDWTIDSGLTAQPNYLFEWRKDGVIITDVNGVPEAGPTLQLSPATAPPDVNYPFGLTTTPATYSLTVYVVYPTYICQIAYDQIILGYLPEIPIVVPTPITKIECTTALPPYNVDLVQEAQDILGPANRPIYKVSYYDTSSNASDGGVTGLLFSDDNPGTWTYTINDTAVHTIWIRIEDYITGCSRVESIAMSFSPQPSGNISYPQSPYCTVINTPQPITTDVTPGGVYSSSTGLSIDPNTGAINPNLSTPGNYVVNYNLAALGNCPAFSPTPTNVTIVLSPTAPVVATPITYCKDETSAALTATGVGLLWYSAASGGTGSALAPTPDTTTSGNTTYYVTQTNGGCESPRSAIVVDVLPVVPEPTVPGTFTYCQNDSATVLSATGTNLLWYTAASGGTGNPAAPTPSTIAGGTTTYYVSQTISGCESQRATIDVIVNPTPALPTVTSPLGYCQNDTAAPLSATGSNLLWYLNATGGIGNPIAPTVSTLAMGSTSYYVSQTLNGCEGPRAVITVNVTATLPAPLVTTPVTYCQGSSSVPLTATGSSLMWYANATGGTGSTTAPTPSTAAPGSTIYYVSQAGGCEGPRAAITVDILPSPLAPAVSTPITYCQNTTATALTATGNGLLWYANATGGTGSATAPTPSTTTAGTTTYYVSQTVSGCEGPRAAIDVTVYATPALPVVVSPVGYCQDGAAVALSAIGSGLLWYSQPIGGSGNSVAPTPLTTAPGNTTYYVSQTIDGCEGPRASILVTVTPTPNPPVVNASLTYCENATALQLTATGSNLLWYIDPLNGVGSTTAPTPATNVPGITAYYVSQTVNGCESTRAIILVDILAAPAAPAVTPVTYCQNATATPLSATGASLLWYANATGGTGTSTAPTPVTSAAGTATYYVSQTIIGCESPRASITVTIYPTPALPTVTSPVNYCQNGAANPLTASGSNLLWYTVATGGTGVSTAPTPATTSSGSATYYVSQTINGCEGPRAPIVVNINPAPAAPVISTPLTYCQNASATQLTATGSNLLWYTTATGGTGSALAPTPNTFTAGTFTFYVSQSSSGCESLRSAIVVNVIALPAAPVIAPISYCQNATAVPLTASGSNLLWYTSATGGTGSVTAPTPTTAIAGIKNYYVSQTANGCEGPRAAIAVTVYATPALPTVTTPVVYCQNETAVSLVATGSNLLWYTTFSGGTGSTIVPVPLTVNAGSTTYYVSQTLNGCEGPRAAIVVNVNPTPEAPLVTSPIAYCQNEAASSLTATGSNLLWYTTSSGGTGNATAPVPSTASVGSTAYYVSQTANGCEGPRASITVNINELPTPTLQDGSICVDQNNNVVNPFTFDSGLPAGTFSFEWFAVNGTTFVPIAGNANTHTESVPGTYGVRATNVSTGCASDIVTATIVLSPSPNAINIVVSEYFSDDQRITVNVSPTGSYQYQLDNGALQNSNVFVDVPPGTHNVLVKSECGVYNKEVFLLDFPRFFTPNGDGYNDVWNIFALSGQANAKIYIFDRFGKLLKEISPSGAGWDGTFNHQTLPSTDYWFIVHYEENNIGKIFKSHFALKR